MKPQLEQLLQQAVNGLVGGMLPTSPEASQISVERTRDAQHGDFASNVAMRLAKPARRNPRELAAAIAAALPANELIERTEVAGAGFINFYLRCAASTQELGRIHERGEAYGRSNAGGGERVLVEFVSANPTGPLHVGHGRQAAYGATLANLLAATGFTVTREYYIHDAARQMGILAVSTWIRYLQRCGETLSFPANGYRGDYVRTLARELQHRHAQGLRAAAAHVTAGLPPDAPEGDPEVHIDALIARCRALIGEEGFRSALALSRDLMIADIRDDLQGFGVEFDRWYSEGSLARSGASARALERLQSQRHLCTQDIAADIAHHLDKRERGFARRLDVLGADHHGYVARVRAGLQAMGEPGASLEVSLIGFVNLFRGGERIAMGKREAPFVTLRELREEVGNDACRFFYLMRSHDQQLDFDLSLAAARNNDNPVYYIQYAHARVASVLKQLAAKGLTFDLKQGLAHATLLTGPHEQALLQTLSRYPESLGLAANQRAPHTLVHYLGELAHAFHAYYDAEQFIVPEAPLRNARLALVTAARQVIRNGLTLLGVSAPESM